MSDKPTLIERLMRAVSLPAKVFSGESPVESGKVLTKQWEERRKLAEEGLVDESMLALEAGVDRATQQDLTAIAGRASGGAERAMVITMNRQTWLTSKDPNEMLFWVPNASDSKVWQAASDRLTANKYRAVRLILCAAARTLHSHADHPDVKAVISACEDVADGQPSSFGHGIKGLRVARKSIDAAYGWVWAATQESPGDALRQTLHTERSNSGSFYNQHKLADVLREVIGNPFGPQRLYVAGPMTMPRMLAQAAYDERMPDGSLDRERLLVLADCLEENGLNDEEIFNHLRNPSLLHHRGCWVVDLLIGKLYRGLSS